MKVLAGLAVLVVVFGLLLAIGSMDSGGDSYEMTPAERAEITRTIQEFGFNCPQAKIAHLMGQDAYGAVTKIYCGPAGRDGVYPETIFRLTFVGGDRVMVRPWDD